MRMEWGFDKTGFVNLGFMSSYDDDNVIDLTVEVPEDEVAEFICYYMTRDNNQVDRACFDKVIGIIMRYATKAAEADNRMAYEEITRVIDSISDWWEGEGTTGNTGGC